MSLRERLHGVQMNASTRRGVDSSGNNSLSNIRNSQEKKNKRKTISPARVFHNRLLIVYVFIIMCLGVFTYKLVDLQIVNHEVYARVAEGQYVGVVHDLFDRGGIFFTGKSGERIPAALVRYGYKVYAHPNKVENPQEAYDQLSELIDLDKDTFFEQLADTRDTYEELAYHIDLDTADAVRDLGLSGVGITGDQWREYPGGSLAAHAIGFVAYDGDILNGRYGLEKYYEGLLAHGQEKIYVNTFAQIFSDLHANVSASQKDEADILTTLEPQVQDYLDERISEVKDTWKADHAGAIIMNPSSGAIYAMSGSENFDLNDFGSVNNVSSFSNPLVQDVYEMGSIVKPLVMAMALEEDIVNPQTDYDDQGSVDVGDYTIYNFDKQARGVVSMTEVLQKSLNTGMVYIGELLGKERMRDYFTQLGITERTGIDLPYEVNNLTQNLLNGGPVEFANMSFGQGIALTPMSMVRSFAVLANDGVLAEPHLVWALDYNHGGITKRNSDNSEEEREERRVFSSQTTEEVTRMLTGIVDESFKDEFPQLETYSIAAKTGTAQIANELGGYYDDKYMHALAGYFPAYDPEYLVFYYLVNPKEDAQYSSETLANPFMETIDFLRQYYTVPPDRVVSGG